MKKTLGVVAAAALAAAPAVAVLAADGNLTTTDTVKVTIDSACTLTATGTGTYETALANGAYTQSDLGSTSINIKCNDKGGWKVNAVGANTSTVGSAGVTDMAPANATSTPIPSTTENLDGTKSGWAMKLTAGASDAYGLAIETGFDTYAAVPGTATKVAHGNTTDQTTGSTFTTGYKVSISPTQQADTYTGKVTYTLVHPNS